MRAAAGLALLGTLAAQQPLLQVELAADPERSGPPALVWLRERFLGPRIEAPALGPLALKIEADGTWSAGAVAEPPAQYLSARIAAAGLRGRIDGDAGGLEQWQLEADPLPPRFAALIRRLGLDRLRGPVTLDVAALIGNLAAVLDEGDPLAPLLALAPAECGEVMLVAQRTGAGRWELRGRGDGGLLLPALLILLADLRARPDGGLDGAGAVAGDEPWRMLAASARDCWREEAAHQLARSRTPQAAERLHALLHADGDASLATIAALAQRDQLEPALDALLVAATPQEPDRVALAAIAVRTLLPQLDAAARAQAQARLLAHPSAELRALATWSPAPPPVAAPPPIARWLAFGALLLSAVALWATRRS